MLEHVSWGSCEPLNIAEDVLDYQPAWLASAAVTSPVDGQERAPEVRRMDLSSSSRTGNLFLSSSNVADGWEESLAQFLFQTRVQWSADKEAEKGSVSCSATARTKEQFTTPTMLVMLRT